METKKRYKDYADYLKSPKWEQVKSDYILNNYHEDCALCGSLESLQHHHWKYPKDWNDDCHTNLIRVCGLCHSSLHDGDKKEYVSLIDFMSDVIYSIRCSEQEMGIVIGQDDVLKHVLQVVDVIQVKSLTSDRREEYRFESNKGTSTKCNLMPLGRWGAVTSGKKQEYVTNGKK